VVDEASLAEPGPRPQRQQSSEAQDRIIEQLRQRLEGQIRINQEQERALSESAQVQQDLAQQLKVLPFPFLSWQ